MRGRKVKKPNEKAKKDQTIEEDGDDGSPEIDLGRGKKIDNVDKSKLSTDFSPQKCRAGSKCLRSKLMYQTEFQADLIWLDKIVLRASKGSTSNIM